MTEKIILIGGYGRSGSTMLEIILSDFCGAVGVGEVKNSWERGFINGDPCSCGAAGDACPFWQAVLAEVRQKTGLGIKDINALRLQVERNRYFFAHRVLGLPRGRYRRARQRYMDVLRVLYEAVWRVSGRKIIIDSSKDPAHIDLVAGIFPDKAVVLHLVRDPRAVVFSRRYSRNALKKKRRDGLWSSSIQWVAINLFTARLRRAHPYVLIRYEDAFRSTGQLLSTFEESPPIAQCRSASSGEGVDHSTSGNPVRLEEPRTLALRVDKRWQDQLPNGERRLVEWFCGPVMKRFGYRPTLRSGASEGQ